MNKLTPALLNLPPMSDVASFARLVGLSESTIRRCIRATKPTEHGWPPLAAKRMPDGQLKITAAAAAEWLASFPDA